jgi:GTPase SAR1 family protein
MLGLEKAGKTHMLYSYLVSEGGMQTIKKLKETQGMNFEHVVETSSNFEVWDTSGGPFLRKNWALFCKNIPVSAIVYVININEDHERLKEAK